MRYRGEELANGGRDDQPLTSGDHMVEGHRKDRAPCGRDSEQLQRDVRQEQPLDPLADDHVEHRIGVTPDFVGDDDEAATSRERGKHFLEGDVERARGELQRAQAGHTVGDLPGDQPAQAAMGHRDSLRHAGRAGRVQDIGERIRIMPDGRERSSRCWPGWRHGEDTIAQAAGVHRLCNRDADTKPPQARARARGRVSGIDRAVHAACREHGEHRDHGVGRVVQRDSDRLLRPHTVSCQLPGQGLSPLDQLGVTQRSTWPAGPDHSDGTAIGPCLGLDDVVHGQRIPIGSHPGHRCLGLAHRTRLSPATDIASKTAAADRAALRRHSKL